MSCTMGRAKSGLPPPRDLRCSESPSWSSSHLAAAPAAPLDAQARCNTPTFTDVNEGVGVNGAFTLDSILVLIYVSSEYRSKLRQCRLQNLLYLVDDGITLVFELLTAGAGATGRIQRRRMQMSKGDRSACR